MDKCWLIMKMLPLATAPSTLMSLRHFADPEALKNEIVAQALFLREAGGNSRGSPGAHIAAEEQSQPLGQAEHEEVDRQDEEQISFGEVLSMMTEEEREELNDMPLADQVMAVNIQRARFGKRTAGARPGFKPGAKAKAKAKPGARVATPPRTAVTRESRCANCGGKHATRDCNEERVPFEKRKCFNCNGEGHQSKDCPMPPKKNDKKAFAVMAPRVLCVESEEAGPFSMKDAFESGTKCTHECADDCYCSPGSTPSKAGSGSVLTAVEKTTYNKPEASVNSSYNPGITLGDFGFRVVSGRRRQSQKERRTVKFIGEEADVMLQNAFSALGYSSEVDKGEIDDSLAASCEAIDASVSPSPIDASTFTTLLSSTWMAITPENMPITVIPAIDHHSEGMHEDDTKDHNYDPEVIRAAMRNYRLFFGEYFREIELQEIEETSLGVRGWASATGIIPSEIDLTGTVWEPSLDNDDVIPAPAGELSNTGNLHGDEAKETWCPCTRGNCVSFHEPNSESVDQETLDAKARAMSVRRLHEHLGPEKVALLTAIGALEQVEDMVCVTTLEDDCDDVLMPMSQWVDTEIELTLDSGCCEHVLDVADAPGYAHFISESPGSKRGQRFIVGNGERVPNDGQVRLNMECAGIPLQSVFQVASVTRPLMSVGRVCGQGLKCIFDQDKALVVGKDGEEVCRFERKGGLYVARLKLKSPELFPRPAA